MTTRTTLSADTQAGQKDLPGVAGKLQTHTPPQIAAFLIANLELKLIVSHRTISSLEIPNRKKTLVSRPPEWLRHSCLPRGTKGLPRGTKGLCVFARPQTRPTKPVTSLQSSFQNLIETPRLEFPATATKLSPLPISNRDNFAFCVPHALAGWPLSSSPRFRSRLSPTTSSAGRLSRRIFQIRLSRRASHVTRHKLRVSNFSPRAQKLFLLQPLC